MHVQPKDESTLRHEQIQMRCAEMAEARLVLERIARGDRVEKYSSEACEFDWGRWRNVDTSRPVVVGHSLGGAAAVSR